MNTIAQKIVTLSRFFSMMLVPVCVEYMLEAIASEMPVPFPLCIKMNTTSPVPEMNSKTSKNIANGDILYLCVK